MNLRPKNPERGSVLVVVMFTSLAIGIVLASYLLLVSNRYKLTVRSMGWNAAMPVAEAGVEEALSQVYRNLAAPTADNWTATMLGGQRVYTKQRTLPDGSFYSVALNILSSESMVVYSTGFTPSPLATNQYISRTVRVSITNRPTVFIKAIAAYAKIAMGGNGIIDGFDSRLGPYDIYTNRNATGSFATDSSADDAIDVGNALVYGTVSTGPGGRVQVGSQGAVGDDAWIAGNNGIQPGWSDDTMNVAFPTNAPPSGSFAAPGITSGGGSNIMYLGNVTNKVNTSLSISGAKNPMIVTGDATLWVTGDFEVKSGGYINILPGASLTLIAGGQVSIGGGGVANGLGLASRFSVVGLPSCTSMSYNGNTAFIGNVNAPQAAFNLVGTSDAYGSIIVKSASFSGGGSFHYDAALARGGVLTVINWTEL